MLPQSSRREAHCGAHGTRKRLRLLRCLPAVVEVVVHLCQDALDSVFGLVGAVGKCLFEAPLAEVIVVADQAFVALATEVRAGAGVAADAFVTGQPGGERKKGCDIGAFGCIQRSAASRVRETCRKKLTREAIYPRFSFSWSELLRYALELCKLYSESLRTHNGIER